MSGAAAGHPGGDAGGAVGAARVCGPAYPLAARLLASALVLALCATGASVLLETLAAPAASSATPSAATWGFIAAVVGVIGFGWWVILASRSCIDDEHIEQTGPWRKRVRLADISRVKLVRVPGLERVIVPRLVVRTSDGLTTFAVGDPAVLRRVRLLVEGR